jgi:2'-5' RNA ligase
VRLFLALDLAPSLADAVEDWAGALEAHLGASARGLRWTTPAQRHLTLHFLGEVTSLGASALSERMARGVTCPPFTLSLGNPGLFPAHGRPRVVWLALQDPTGTLSALHATVAGHLRALELPLDDRPFQPHVTVARVRDDADRQLGRTLRAWCATMPRRASAPVTRLTCYESRVSPGGSSYHSLFEAPFVAA